MRRGNVPICRSRHQPGTGPATTVGGGPPMHSPGKRAKGNRRRPLSGVLPANSGFYCRTPCLATVDLAAYDVNSSVPFYCASFSMKMSPCIPVVAAHRSRQTSYLTQYTTNGDANNVELCGVHQRVHLAVDAPNGSRCCSRLYVLQSNSSSRSTVDDALDGGLADADRPGGLPDGPQLAVGAQDQLVGHLG
jgi:hypothetical protein